MHFQLFLSAIRSSAKFILLLLLSLYLVASARGQLDTLQVPKRFAVQLQDTLFVTERDTTIIYSPGDSISIVDLNNEKTKAFYDSLKAKSERHKVTGLLYDLMIREEQRVVDDTSNFVDSKAPFYAYQGKRIRSINFKKVAVLDGSVLDTTLVKSTGVGRAANALHVNTRTGVLRGLLMFDVGEQVSANAMADSERLIRQLRYIQDALIIVHTSEEDPNEVDVFVITQDRFSIIVGGSPSSLSKFKFKLGERNFLGSGRKLQATYIYNGNRDPASGIDLEFNDPSLFGLYINTTVRWLNNYDRQGWEFLSQRDLYAPGVKWIGGLELSSLNVNRFRTDSVDVVEEIYPYEAHIQDAWIGRSFQVGGEESRSNVTITQRYYNQSFEERPFVSSDSNYIYQNGSGYLAGISFTKQVYQKSSKILSFGITEDVPSGILVELNPGVSFGEFNTLPYLGYRISAGKYIPKFGYLAGTHRLGGLIDEGTYRDGLYDFRIGYFSPLKRFPKREFRQFVNFRFLKALNRASEPYIDLSKNDRNVDLDDVEGDRLLSVDLESVIFHPRKWYGFQLASYVFTNFGWLADDSQLIRKSNFFGAVGVGFRIRNESFAIQTLQISLGYFIETIDNIDSFFYDINVDDPLLFDSFRGLKPEVLRFE